MTKPDPFLTDDENPELTDADFARMRPAREVLGNATVDALMKRQRGRPKSDSPKIPVKLRLDPAILEWFKATGDGWQTRINDALAESVRLARGEPDVMSVEAAKTLARRKSVSPSRAKQESLIAAMGWSGERSLARLAHKAVV